MEDEIICPKSSTCPIYSGILQSNEALIETFKSMYCENGLSGREDCKRYQVSKIAGCCPPDILPNSDLPVDTIIILMEHQKCT